MRFRFHVVMLGTPLILWILWWGANLFGQAQTDRYIKDVNGLTWNFNEIILKAEVDTLKEGEIELFIVKIIDTSGKVL